MYSINISISGNAVELEKLNETYNRKNYYMIQKLYETVNNRILE